VRYFLQDRLSTRVITDASGTLVGREDHLPFGEDSGTGSGETESIDSRIMNETQRAEPIMR